MAAANAWVRSSESFSGWANAATMSVPAMTAAIAGSRRRARRSQNPPRAIAPVRCCSFMSRAHTSHPERMKNTSTPM